MPEKRQANINKLSASFAKSADFIKRYFEDKEIDPDNATNKISGERYIGIRATNLALGFHDVTRSIYGSAEEATHITNSLLYDLAFSMSKSDAKLFHKKMNISDPIEKLSAGPLHFAYTGMASATFDPRSNMSQDEDFLLIYTHSHSFESNSWLEEKRHSEHPVCIMSCGYSAGWCSASFDIPVVAVEHKCKARGDDCCAFIAAHASHIEAQLVKYLGEDILEKVHIPRFFGRKEEEDKLSKMAFQDSLTKLPNRASFHEKLVEALVIGKRNSVVNALLFIDLDGFKGINDTFGHDAGDFTLVKVAERLNNTVRSSDVCARLGGDEFAVLLQDCSDEAHCKHIAQNIIDAVSLPLEFKQDTLSVGASIGIKIIQPFPESTPEQVIKDADSAMYQAKQAGKNCFRLA